MKVLFIPYGTELAPATRYRVMQCIPEFKSKGITCRVFSAISGFSTGLMIKSPGFNHFWKFVYYAYVFLERLARFFRIIFMAGGFDIIFLQRTTFPFNLERLLSAVNKNIIFDIDDAIYMPDNQAAGFLNRIKRYVKKEEVVNILAVSRVAVVENEYIKEFVSKYCGNIYKIPGPIDTERFCLKPEKKDDYVVLGWIGSPATTFYLHMLDNVFRDIEKNFPSAKLRLVGAGDYKNPDISFEKTPWRYDTEVSELHSFDIGIMPMPDDEWTRGKLGCKMLQYMAVGTPAVVSYTPTNAEIIKNGINGYFASNDGEWIKIIKTLIEDKSLRQRIGLNGREAVLQKCALSGSISTYLDIFKRLKDGKKK